MSVIEFFTKSVKNQTLKFILRQNLKNDAKNVNRFGKISYESLRNFSA